MYILSFVGIFNGFYDLGLEEFQEKIENFGNDILEENDPSWIGQTVKKFFRLGSDEDELSDHNPEYEEGLEPPVLDLRWGLNDPVSTQMCSQPVFMHSCTRWWNKEERADDDDDDDDDEGFS